MLGNSVHLVLNPSVLQVPGVIDCQGMSRQTCVSLALGRDFGRRRGTLGAWGELKLRKG